MAAIESKRSLSTAQGQGQDRGRAHAATKPAVTTPKRRQRLPAQPPPSPRVTKRGKTTISRFRGGRTVYRFDEIKGKIVAYVQFYTMGEYHSIDIRFQDKTMLHFVIEPGFTLETEHASIKSGNWRCIKRWPMIRSEGFN